MVDRDGPRLRRGLGTVEQVEVLADRLRFQLGKGIFGAAYLEANIERSRRNLDRVLRDLWQLLLAPIGNVLRDARHLVVVPHGPLHGLPLHAAFDGASYLADRCTLSYAPSGRTFIACAERKSGPVRRPLFVGPQEDLLPAAAGEARTLANMFPDGDSLIGRRATVAGLRRRAGRFDALHLPGITDAQGA